MNEVIVCQINLKPIKMKKQILIISLMLFSTAVFSQEILHLNPPSDDRGVSVMQALSLRSSTAEFNSAELELDDLSDLLWAANGINRPDESKRTAPSAMNAQDIDIYVFMSKAVYLYDAKKHDLVKITDGDYRKLVAGRQETMAVAPVFCILVSDISRFRSGEEGSKLTWAAMDAGIVSQNISLFCASVGMKTRPRATMEQEKLRDILQLKDTQHLMLNHPVSY